MYLLRRGALLHFSRKLPDAFQGQNLNVASGPRKVGGNGYLRFSLGTGNRRDAERLARRYAVEVDEALQAETASMHREIPWADETEGTILKELFDTLPAEQQARLLQREMGTPYGTRVGTEPPSGNAAARATLSDLSEPCKPGVRSSLSIEVLIPPT